MAEKLKISGKRVDMPAAGDFTFTQRPGGWIIAQDASGKRHRFAIHESRGKIAASLGGALYLGEVIQNQRVSSGAAQSDADLIAQFPGKVRKVLVTVGATVAQDEPLLLIEAMKMEFAVKAPFAGKITKIHVTEGQQLSPGTRFLDLAEKKDNG